LINNYNITPIKLLID